MKIILVLLILGGVRRKPQMIGLAYMKYLLCLKLSFSSWLQFPSVNRFDQNSSQAFLV